MKSTKLLFLTLSSLSCISASPYIRLPFISFDQICGAYTGEENDNVVVAVSSATEDMVLKISYYITSTGANVLNETIPLAGTISNGTAKLNYTLKIKNRLSSYGLTITLTLSGAREYNPVSITLYPIISNTINAFDYAYKDYSITGTVFRLRNNGVNMYTETFSFSNTIDSIFLGSEFGLDISELCFNYNITNGISETGDYYLEIYDPTNVFSNFDHDENWYTLIPLKLTAIGTDVYINYAQTLYYNPTTFKTSPIKSYKFVETDKLMIPPSFVSNLQTRGFTVVLNDVGYNKTTIRIPLILNDPLPNIGLCHSSKFCVRGGIIE